MLKTSKNLQLGLVLSVMVLPLQAGWMEAYGPSRENFVPFAASTASATVGGVASLVLLRKIFRAYRQELGELREKVAANPNDAELKVSYGKAKGRLLWLTVKLAAALGLTYVGVKGLCKHVPKNELIRNKEAIHRESQEAALALQEAWTNAGNDPALGVLIAEHGAELVKRTATATDRRAKLAAAADRRAAERRRAGPVAGGGQSVVSADAIAPHEAAALKSEYDKKIVAHLIARGDARAKGWERAEKLAAEEKEQKLHEQVYRKHYSWWELFKKNAWSGALPDKEILVEGRQITLPRDAEALIV